MATVALKQYQHYIGGEWVDAADGATFESFNPATGEPWYTAARGSAEDMHRAVAAAKQAFEAAVVARASRRRSAATCVRKLGDLDRRERRAARDARVDATTASCSARCACSSRVLPEYYCYFGGLPTRSRATSIPALRARAPQLHAARAARRGRRDHPVELAAAADLDEARARRSRPGNTIVRQAVRAHLGLAARADAAGRGGRASRRASSTSSPARRRRRRRARRPPAASRKIAFTGGTGDRPRDRRAGRRAAARVTLELGGKSPQLVFDDADPTQRRDGHPRRHLRRRRPDLRGRLARCSCRRPSTTSCSSASLERTRTDPDRRPARRRDRARPAGARQQLEKVQALRRDRREDDGATLLHGGERRRRGAGRRLVLRADDLHRRAQRHAGLPGGDLRAGRVGDAVPRRGRGRRARQRQPVRARRRRLDARPGAGAPHGRRARRRHRLDQHLPRDVADVAVGRVQASPAWARRTARR